MSKCWNCGVSLRDPGHVCPLCRCIVEGEGAEKSRQLYPFLHAERGIKKIQRALSIYVFAAIVLEVLLGVIDIAAGGKPGWLILIGVLLVYCYLTLKVSVQMHTGYRLRMMMQVLLGVAVLFVIDLETGFIGWSLNFVLPAAFMLMDLAVLVLMIANNRNWQSYIPLEILLIALCVIPFIFFGLGVVTALIVAVIALIFAILMFLGTVIVGGQRARDELYRRFRA